MPAQQLTTDALVLSRRPPSDAFQQLTLFSASHGTLLALQRIPKKPSANLAVLDLFDEAALILESSNQGQTWFVKEPRLIARHAGIGRDYDALRHACALAALVAHNPAPGESRPRVYALLQTAFAAFAGSTRPDIVFFKSLYLLARDEGHPVKQHWFSSLPAADRELAAALLNRPLSAQSAAPAVVSRLQRQLETYLRGHTELFAG